MPTSARKPPCTLHHRRTHHPATVTTGASTITRPVPAACGHAALRQNRGRCGRRGALHTEPGGRLIVAPTAQLAGGSVGGRCPHRPANRRVNCTIGQPTIRPPLPPGLDHNIPGSGGMWACRPTAKPGSVRSAGCLAHGTWRATDSRPYGGKRLFTLPYSRSPPSGRRGFPAAAGPLRRAGAAAWGPPPSCGGSR